MNKEKMRVFFVVAEMTPLAKVGGLADVAGSLPKALAQLGMDITILLPKYAAIDEQKFGLKPLGKEIKVQFGGESQTLRLWTATLSQSSVPIILFEHQEWISGGGIYPEIDASSGGSKAELSRFGLFAAAAAEYLNMERSEDDAIVHCNDWHVALAVPLLKNLCGTSAPKILLTIHNLAYQGIYRRDLVEQSLDQRQCGAIPNAAWIGPDRDRANFLAAGILTTDWVSTVSPSYRDEILTPEEGAGLDWALLARQEHFVGILNGIDTDEWNPATDKSLVKNYDASHVELKLENKFDLQKILKLQADPKIFLLGMVSRLTEQKGFDVLLPAIPEILHDQKIQLVILATGDPRYAAELQGLRARFEKQLRFADRFDEELAHKIYAGADAFLMPSRFEPCGLGQMIAMRYGTIPIVRATGGLRDTVSGVGADKERGTGFIFESYLPKTLSETIRNACEQYRDKNFWSKLQQRAMAQDFSWTASAKHYLELYRQIIAVP